MLASVHNARSRCLQICGPLERRPMVMPSNANFFVSAKPRQAHYEIRTERRCSRKTDAAKEQTRTPAEFLPSTSSSSNQTSIPDPCRVGVHSWSCCPTFSHQGRTAFQKAVFFQLGPRQVPTWAIQNLHAGRRSVILRNCLPTNSRLRS